MGSSSVPVLVTGGSGFVGTHVVRAPRRRGELQRYRVGPASHSRGGPERVGPSALPRTGAGLTRKPRRSPIEWGKTSAATLRPSAWRMNRPRSAALPQPANAEGDGVLEMTARAATALAGRQTPGLTAIVTALPEELAPLVKRARQVRSMDAGAGRIFVGLLGGTRVAMMVTGMGPRRAEQRVRALLDAVRATKLVGLGLAGGISPGLEEGEILVAREVRGGPGVLADPDASWLERALDKGARGAILVTVGELIGDRARKAALFGRLSAAGAAAVDMESASWARVATERGVPYVILRSVFDRAEDDLPDFFGRCQDREGGLSRGKIVREALLRPQVVPRLLSMRRQVQRCTERLAECVERLLAQEPEIAPAPGEVPAGNAR
jgi:adenosylhomocysteine nucleosidase